MDHSAEFRQKYPRGLLPESDARADEEYDAHGDGIRRRRHPLLVVSDSWQLAVSGRAEVAGTRRWQIRRGGRGKPPGRQA